MSDRTSRPRETEPDLASRRETIKGAVANVVEDLMYFDHREHSHAPELTVEAAVAAGDVTAEELVQWFDGAIQRALR